MLEDGEDQLYTSFEKEVLRWVKDDTNILYKKRGRLTGIVTSDVGTTY